MCIIHNTVGSLAQIKTHLSKNGLNEFRSVRELLDFKKNYPDAKQLILATHSELIKNERVRLAHTIKELASTLEQKRAEIEKQTQQDLIDLQQQLETLPMGKNLLAKARAYVKKHRLRQAFRKQEHNFSAQIDQHVLPFSIALAEQNNRFNYINTHFEEAVYQSSFYQLQELDRKKQVIEELNSFIYGAMGEQKVVKELLKLSDDYILINDFNCCFQPAIYRHQQDEYIKSIQVDHLLISPSGVFIIETKNWSEQSIKSLQLRSPIEQIKRTNFALFRLLAADGTVPRLALNGHRWGERKIALKNLIVLMNQKPNEDFQHVKVVTLHELLGYVQYFKPTLSISETQMIADHLLRLNGKIHHVK